MNAKRLLTTGLVIGGAVASAMYMDVLRRRASYSFAGRSIVITGGSRGLGLIMARYLVAEGARVALLARDMDELERAHQELVWRNSTRIITLQCDVRNRESVQSAIHLVAQEFGGIDVLINNAGVISVGPIQHMQVPDLRTRWRPTFGGRSTRRWPFCPTCAG